MRGGAGYPALVLQITRSRCELHGRRCELHGSYRQRHGSDDESRLNWGERLGPWRAHESTDHPQPEPDDRDRPDVVRERRVNDRIDHLTRAAAITAWWRRKLLLLLDDPDLDLGSHVGVEPNSHAIDAEGTDRLVEIDLPLLHVVTLRLELVGDVR